MAMAAASLFLLFISCSVVTLSLASVNIDCGTSSGSGLDENNIKWVGDKDFITAGESVNVSTTTVETSLTTLRYFPTGDSNCYTKIPVKKGGKVLVRTMFYYGNYDGESNSPKFEVLFDGKHRGSVTISSASDSFMLELIYIPANGDINICFVRTSSGSNPFVSSIEVIDLDSALYKELGPGEGFFYQARAAYGTTELIRSDHHGRIWFPLGINNVYTTTTSIATSIDTSGASNDPPEAVLRNSWSGITIELQDQTLPSQGVPIYLAMYFSDPMETGASRSFNIFFGGKKVNKVPVVPEFAKTTQVVVRDLVVSSNSKLEFLPTIDAFSPPIINALELYIISMGTSRGGGGSDGGGRGGGSGGSGEGGSRGSNEGSSGGSSNEETKNKLLIIIGAVSAAAFVIIIYAILAIFIGKRRQAKLQALAMPISTASSGTNTGGTSPLFGQHTGSNTDQPAHESNDFDDMTGDNEFYVAQNR